MKLTQMRRRVLALVEDEAQSFRIARKSGLARSTVSGALQWARTAGFVEWGSRWRLTTAGRAALEERGDG